MAKKISEDRKSRVSQSDVPAYSLEQALRIPKAIADNYAFTATSPLEVAAALSLSPASSMFRMMCGSAIAYGLTDGGCFAPEITPTTLARRILEPTAEGEDLVAKREALLRPRVLREFLLKYNHSKLPREDIALNVLAQMGVPRDGCSRTLGLIIEGAKAVGFFTEIKGVAYVNLQGSEGNASSTPKNSETDSAESLASVGTAVPHRNLPPPIERLASTSPATANLDLRRVFITHGKNRSFLEPLKELLIFGEMEPLVSVERESVSQPVPDKVLSDLRKCGAAIIHVDAEQKLIDAEAQQHVVLNPNVLIEIGAALALFGRRLILLVRDGITLPSNLQGLYQVRYTGDKLDGEVTIRLLKAIKDIKNHPLPNAQSDNNSAGGGGDNVDAA